MAWLTMCAAMESCDRLGKVMERQERLEYRIAAQEARGSSTNASVISVKLPELQTEVENGKTNAFYMFGPTKVYVDN